MLAHDGIVMQCAHKPRLRAIVRSQMRMIDDGIRQLIKSAHARLHEDHLIVGPLAAVLRPRLAAKSLFCSAQLQRVVQRFQAGAHVGLTTTDQPHYTGDSKPASRWGLFMKSHLTRFLTWSALIALAFFLSSTLRRPVVG
ncbi:hypothetical protein CMV30_06120 [Nibricoccus aquaticus]|uniref:Uncharacterized protein n=1 Tax=Nibricoccus aquaticus TaxID=2576891 RepID=A0A290Q553_9BACT|nr:hypothetical protein CMV30_06120 [Nibricoccus aquaticus]